MKAEELGIDSVCDAIQCGSCLFLVQAIYDDGVAFQYHVVAKDKEEVYQAILASEQFGQLRSMLWSCYPDGRWIKDSDGYVIEFEGLSPPFRTVDTLRQSIENSRIDSDPMPLVEVEEVKSALVLKGD